MRHTENIKKINRILEKDSPELRLAEHDIDGYFSEFRPLFADFLGKFKGSSEDSERRRLFMRLCELNYLYAVQLKLGYTLPEDLQRVAYDFDNPHYPGYDQIAQKILHGDYSLRGDFLAHPIMHEEINIEDFEDPQILGQLADFVAELAPKYSPLIETLKSGSSVKTNDLQNLISYMHDIVIARMDKKGVPGKGRMLLVENLLREIGRQL
jgi:hypothetical protein